MCLAECVLEAADNGVLRAVGREFVVAIKTTTIKIWARQNVKFDILPNYRA